MLDVVLRKLVGAQVVGVCRNAVAVSLAALCCRVLLGAFSGFACACACRVPQRVVFVGGAKQKRSAANHLRLSPCVRWAVGLFRC